MIYRRRLKTLTNDQINQTISFMHERTKNSITDSELRSYNRTHKLYIPILEKIKTDKSIISYLSELEVRDICWYLDQIGILKEAQ